MALVVLIVIAAIKNDFLNVVIRGLVVYSGQELSVWALLLVITLKISNCPYELTW